MKTIVGIRFKKPGKIYFFDPEDLKLANDDSVIVETSQGEEFGKVVIANRMIPEEKVVKPLKKVIRKATNKDIKALVPEIIEPFTPDVCESPI